MAITVRQEIPLNVAEREHLKTIVRVRRRRRMAASRICRWWKRLSQNRMLKEALLISGCEQYSIDELRAELSTSELKLLQENLRHANRKDEMRSSKMNSLASNVLHWQNKSSGALFKMMQSPQKRMSKDPASPGASVNSHKSQNMAEVESLMKNAIKRSAVASVSSMDGDCGSEMTDDTEPSEASADNSEKKRNRLQKFAEKMAAATQSPTSPRRERHIVTVEQAVAPPVEPEREIGKWAREKGRESYQTMKHAGRHGIACIMEQCYVLVGCRPDEHVLLLGPLQELVNAERKVFSS